MCVCVSVHACVQRQDGTEHREREGEIEGMRAIEGTRERERERRERERERGEREREREREREQRGPDC